MNVGDKLVELRHKRGFSQEKLAEVSRISLRTIQRIESNNTKPTGFTLNRLAEALETNLDSLTFQNHSVENAFEVVNKINLSAVVGLVFPFGNLILPYLQWKKNKENSDVNHYGRRVLNFQLLWTITASMCFLVVPIINYALVKHFQFKFLYLTWLVYVVLILINIYLTLRTSTRLNKQDLNIYRFVPQWF